MCGILKRIPDSKPALKNAFIIATSVFYLVGLFDLWGGVFTLAFSSVGAYMIAYFLRGSPFMPWVGFVFLMGHLSYSHILRLIANEPSVVDVTGAQMVLVMKLNAFCWNVADGLLPDDQLSDFQRDHMLKELPSLFDYAAYILFFPSLFAGPAFDYSEYRQWIDTTMFDVPTTVEPAKRPPVRKQRKIPRSGGPAMAKAVVGLLWIGVFVFLGGMYYPRVMLEDSFLEQGFFKRIWTMYLVGLTARTKYYGVWTLTEGACILAGLGYNGVDPETGKISWNRLQNIDPIAVETAQNPRAYLGGWNMNTSKWLRNYIYLRVTPRGKKPGFRASLMTFGTSAFWHGFHPGYYMSFILASFIQTGAKNFRRYIRPFFLDPHTGEPTPNKKIYDVICPIATQLIFSFVVVPFLVLSFQGSLEVWSRLYYFAIIGVGLAIVFFQSPAKAFLRKNIELRQAKGRFSAQRPAISRSASNDSLASNQNMLGVSSDIQKDVSEMVEEIKADMEIKHRSTQKQN
ncbi:hypothetical protein TD95_001594 [Thielaviopsis punctulata]|uniref:Lysophospholipid acyltransferase n=1 Tax=Thielaviopsis punctulata TaxID=72032 RepID=A0A0F4ZGZ8_9PEZI|nr:hypothetical protein TD95_001594 [Thielaviopsis punctulata]